MTPSEAKFEDPTPEDLGLPDDWWRLRAIETPDWWRLRAIETAVYQERRTKVKRGAVRGRGQKRLGGAVE